MKEYFREYYGLTPQQLKGFFDSCLFVFDTNALLDLYRLDISDAKEVISVIKHYEDRVIIPYHVAEEYHTELLNVISKSIQNSDETLKYDYDTAITNFLTNISKFRDLPFALQEKYNRKLEDVIAELKTDVAGRKENLKKCMEGWDLQCQVADLLGKLLQHPLSLDRINEIVTVDGPKRYAASIPPGYKDMKKTNGNEYGDLIIWQEILDCAKDKKKSIAFISRDLKEDWIEKRNGINCGPRRELRKEFYEAYKEGEFYIYTLTQFLQYAKDATIIDEERALSLITNVEQLKDNDEKYEKNQNKYEDEFVTSEEKYVDEVVSDDYRLSEEKLVM